MYCLLRVKSIEIPRVLITRSAYLVMSAYRQRGGESEGGGILIGEFYPSTNEYRVLVATKPSNFDRRGRYFFDRDAANATRIAQRFWRRSKGRMNYLGEWHTHPEPVPHPSFPDKISMGKLRKDSSTVDGCLLLLIIGQESDWIGCWSEMGYMPISFEITD